MFSLWCFGVVVLFLLFLFCFVLFVLFVCCCFFCCFLLVRFLWGVLLGFFNCLFLIGLFVVFGVFEGVIMFLIIIIIIVVFGGFWVFFGFSVSGVSGSATV